MDSFAARRLSELAQAVALAYLGLMLWQAFHPESDPSELWDGARGFVARKWDERGQWARTLQRIRDLPETDDREDPAP